MSGRDFLLLYFRGLDACGRPVAVLIIKMRIQTKGPKDVVSLGGKDRVERKLPTLSPEDLQIIKDLSIPVKSNDASRHLIRRNDHPIVIIVALRTRLDDVYRNLRIGVREMICNVVNDLLLASYCR